MGEGGGPGLSHCSIPGSPDAGEPAAGGVNSGVSQSVYRVYFPYTFKDVLTCDYCIKMF